MSRPFFVIGSAWPRGRELFRERAPPGQERGLRGRDPALISNPSICPRPLARRWRGDEWGWIPPDPGARNAAIRRPGP